MKHNRHVRWGTPQKTQVILWRVGPLQYRLPPLGECSKNPSVSCTSWCYCERLSLASENFFFKTLATRIVHLMMDDLGAHLPTPHWVFNSFWPKTAWPPCPTLPTHPISLQVTFSFSPWMKKVLKGKCFVLVEEVKQKMAEALKGIKINEFKNCFVQWEKNVSTGGSHQMESPSKVTEFKYVRINTQLFINKFHFGGAFPLIRLHIHVVGWANSHDFILADQYLPGWPYSAQNLAPPGRLAWLWSAGLAGRGSSLGLVLEPFPSIDSVTMLGGSSCGGKHFSYPEHKGRSVSRVTHFSPGSQVGTEKWQSVASSHIAAPMVSPVDSLVSTGR